MAENTVKSQDQLQEVESPIQHLAKALELLGQRVSQLEQYGSLEIRPNRHFKPVLPFRGAVMAPEPENA